MSEVHTPRVDNADLPHVPEPGAMDVMGDPEEAEEIENPEEVADREAEEALQEQKDAHQAEMDENERAYQQENARNEASEASKEEWEGYTKAAIRNTKTAGTYSILGIAGATYIGARVFSSIANFADDTTAWWKKSFVYKGLKKLDPFNFMASRPAEFYSKRAESRRKAAEKLIKKSKKKK